MGFAGQREGELRIVDQLGFIISLLNNSKKWPRQSALQLSCFDPVKDHTGQPVRGFPCLQQVGLSHDGAENRIALNAFYPTQYIFDRGYGNYLGLCHLGSYIGTKPAEFARFNCFVGEPRLGDAKKRDLTAFEGLLTQRLEELAGPQ